MGRHCAERVDERAQFDSLPRCQQSSESSSSPKLVIATQWSQLPNVTWLLTPIRLVRRLGLLLRNSEVPQHLCMHREFDYVQTCFEASHASIRNMYCVTPVCLIDGSALGKLVLVDLKGVGPGKP